jgi:hypothetical protein
VELVDFLRHMTMKHEEMCQKLAMESSKILTAEILQNTGKLINSALS